MNEQPLLVAGNCRACAMRGVIYIHGPISQQFDIWATNSTIKDCVSYYAVLTENIRFLWINLIAFLVISYSRLISRNSVYFIAFTIAGNDEYTMQLYQLTRWQRMHNA